MPVLRSLIALMAVALTLGQMPQAIAQGATLFVLIPFEDPTGADPHAKQITETLATSLTAAGFRVNVGEQMNPLSAIASAAQICARTGARGLFVPAGRYEQTMHVTPAMFVSVTHFSTHIDLRLDQIGCDGRVLWSNVQHGDTGRTGVEFGTGNIGADIDSAFRAAITAIVAARTAAVVPPDTLPAAEHAGVTAPAQIGAIVLVPVEEPGISDPHGADMTHSLLLQLQKRGLTVTVASPVDHDTIPQAASALCAQSTAQAILVPHVRIEQSGFSNRSHATFDAALLSCNGAVVAQASHDADMGTLFSQNFTAEATGIFERATGPALDSIFPQTKAAATAGS